MKISSLDPGTRFKLPFTGKVGELVRVGPGAAVVRYENDDTDVEVTDGRTGETKTFFRRGRPVLISASTEVALA